MSTNALDRVLKCPTLPSLPGVAMEVLELTRDKNVPLKRIAEVVQNDQALAVKILKTVNSSFYGLVKPCPTISRAMAYLGIETVKSLVLGFSLVDAVGRQKADDFDFVSFWRRGIYGATGARAFAVATRAYDSEEAFIGALLQDIGMLAMRMALGEPYTEAIAPAGANHASVCACEMEAFGIDHQVAGSALAEKWRLPPQMIETIRSHHHADRVGGEHGALVRLVALANLATAALDDGRRNAALTTYARRAQEWFEIRSDDAVEMLKGISENARELGRLFHLDTGPKADVAELLATANEMLSEHQLEVAAQSRQLRESNDDLRRRSAMDALTGAANRATFDDTLQACFEEAVEHGTPLGALFIDLDRFKQVNDTLGHQAGDAVLVELVRRAHAVVGDSGTVARYGGEEFAVILPGHDLKAAAAIAERLRATIAATPFPLRRADDPAASIPVTASIGVASLDESSRHALTAPAKLIHAADKAVYAAKHGGRNCVRVFAIRPKSDEAPVPAAASPAADGSTGRDPGRTVLLVEDDPLVVALVRSALGDRDGHRLLVAGSGEEAVQMLDRAEPAPDLVVCDLHLPGMSGTQVARQIRSSRRQASVPVVVISADEGPERAEEVQQSGADAFLPKSRLCDDPRQRIQDLFRRWCTSRKVA